MIPILYEYNEAAWTSNGLGRLYDCLTAEVTEERNGIYEAEITYPVDGVSFGLIKKGRIIAMTHDDSGTVQPFQIVRITRPINGVVTFHAVHISYRLNGAVAVGSGISSMADALNLVNNATPNLGFAVTSDITSTEYLPIADGIPKTVRQIINGGAGSIIDTYGGEIECDGWVVYIRRNRGVSRDFTIRYGVNMTEYQDVEDWSDTYNSVVPYYAKDGTIVVGPPQNVNGDAVSWTGRIIRVPLDVTEECGDIVPGSGTVGFIADRIINQKRPDLPLRNMTVDFVRLQDVMDNETLANLYTCRLCDTIKVSFPEYGTTGDFKIVKTVWDALGERYTGMELGNLSTTLSEALGIGTTTSPGGSGGGGGGGIQSVTVTPTITSGTKIAEIDVDGTSTDLYAPAGGGFSPSAAAVSNFATLNATFTPTANGVLTFCYRASANSAAVGINDVTLGRAVAQNTITSANHYATVTIPVIVGHTYKIVTLTNSTSIIPTVTYFGS